ncbi:hypothetical protein DOTSEDRAFT_81910 [Dothistroma septosporum NZE10]|uniref:Uncharacterized protein n=1 Tax=Dothistroma septosporum (strain NZE10 / CBS 128990) TaxID=675120 RepID=N1PJE9_DOTSN|nr:hypothetical protein DOTSEDRAFT_81910 [Dothistroma septosporum NZE10]
MAPCTSLFNYLPAPLANTARRAYNTVVGADFNRDAYQEAHKHASKLEHHNLRVYEDFDAEEEWTGISQTLVRTGEGPMDFEDEAFVIKDYHGCPRQLSFKLSDKAAGTACEAAGVSREYLGTALKYVALEVSRDVGWVMHCKTAVEAVRMVKLRFPVLEDMQRAFGEGSGKIVRPRSYTVVEVAATDDGKRCDEMTAATYGQTQFQVAKSEGNQVYNPELHADVELVPVMSTGPYHSDGENASSKDPGDEDEDDEGSVDADGFSQAS